jgi:FAD dependent oxidoreductase TIGR03364
MTAHFDLAVVGAGIVGLAHALAAARRGKRVIVFDRDAQANGASIRNFGFITVTGQQKGDCWRRAMRSRDVWAEIAPQAGIGIEHTGLAMAVRHPESVWVLEAFCETEMGAACELLSPVAAQARVPHLNAGVLKAVLWSPHELRVESRTAIPKLAAWLERAHGVVFSRSTLVKSVEAPRIETTRGQFAADAVIVCPGEDYLTLFPERIALYRPEKCFLQMLRVDVAGAKLGAAVMSDLGLARYLGYAELDAAQALKDRLAAEQAQALAHGIHLIAVQSADGTLVVGDSHHYGETPPPFAPADVEQLILDEFHAVLDMPQARVCERWTGIYPSAADRLMFVDAPEPTVRIVMITSGTGASTSFAIAEEVIASLFD